MTPDAAAAGEVSAGTLADRVEAGDRVDVLDVRNRDEVDAWRIEGPGVRLTTVPYMEFVSTRATGDPASLVDEDRSYVAVCPEGHASAEIAAALTDAGVDAANLAGGMQAWARVYRSDPIAADATDATVLQYRRPATGCLGYLVADGDDALVVDPLRAFAGRYADDAGKMDTTVKSVLDTHVHADHTSGVRSVADGSNGTPVVSEAAADRGLDGGFETVDDGDTLQVGDCEIAVLATPGHSTGSVSFQVDDLLLTGDALFLEGAPRPDLQRGNDAASDFARTLHETLTDRLADLPDETVVAPGHVPPERASERGPHTARLGELRDRLAAFSTDRERFVERVLEGMGEPPTDVETIVAVNLGRESVDDETAFELELGPNNCAVATD
ncbi:MBL fold metallo-hydrolase [Halobacteriales archaeon SW_12_69_24]|nr:MAG: MBL fold metallo-hydrolase [Halobacteriales archaeon SW_12_69_24]